MAVLTRRTLAALAGGAAVMPLLPAGARAAPGTGTVFTANERDASISAIDLASGRVSSVRMPVAPHNVDAAAGGRLLLAVGADEAGHRSGRHAGDPGRLILLEPVPGGAPRVTAALPAGRHPAHVVADAAARRAFITDAGRMRCWWSISAKNGSARRFRSAATRTGCASVRTGARPGWRT